MQTRRQFLTDIGLAAAGSMVATAALRAQGQARGNDQATRKDTTTLGPMDQSAAKTVQLAPKSNARPQLTPDQRDDVERQIRCQCGCTLNVYTCRTTDFACEVSPAMHRDIVRLVEGGHSAQEIIDAFIDSYGERVMMAPPAKGFNLLGYLTPFAALTVGGVALVTLLRTWGQRARSHDPLPALPASDATADEAARLEAAIRGDE